jgi:hypothetical protein
MNGNLIGSIYGRSSIRLLILFWSVNKHGRHRQFLFLFGRFLKKSSSLGQMKRNLVGVIYGKSFINIANFGLMRTKTWPSQAILVSDWLSSKKHSSLKQLCQMKHLWSHHRQFLFLIGRFLKIFSSETTSPNEPKLDR